jgi:hypothetical protein
VSGLEPVPDALVDLRGAPREGAYVGDPRSASLERALVPGLGRLAAPGRPRGLLRAMRRKTWCWVGVFHEDLVAAAAIADAGYLGLAWAYVAEGDVVTEVAWKSPGAVAVRAGAPLQSSVAMAPRRLIGITPTEAGGLSLTLELPGLRAGFDLGAGRSLTVVSDLGRGAGLPGATVKRCGLTASGAVELGARRRRVDGAFACVDWTTGYFPRRTAWMWSTGAGRASDGRAVGWNLARGVHDDARGRFTENALWLDGEPAPLPPVSFLVGQGRTPWTVRSTGGPGKVDLVFEPRGERAEDVNLLLVSSTYRQPYGTYSGVLVDARGREVRLEGVPGVAEDHVAVW